MNLEKKKSSVTFDPNGGAELNKTLKKYLIKQNVHNNCIQDYVSGGFSDTKYLLNFYDRPLIKFNPPNIEDTSYNRSLIDRCLLGCG